MCVRELVTGLSHVRVTVVVIRRGYQDGKMREPTVPSVDASYCVGDMTYGIYIRDSRHTQKTMTTVSLTAGSNIQCATNYCAFCTQRHSPSTMYFFTESCTAKIPVPKPAFFASAFLLTAE